MTHRYTLLVRGTVISGRGEPDVSAIAWAEATVLALGSDDDVRAVSRGDSHVIDLGGACVVPLGEGSEGPQGLDACWTPEATLEVGGRADLAITESDPRHAGAVAGQRLSPLAVIRGGRVIAGRLPGAVAG